MANRWIRLQWLMSAMTFNKQETDVYCLQIIATNILCDFLNSLFYPCLKDSSSATYRDPVKNPLIIIQNGAKVQFERPSDLQASFEEMRTDPLIPKGLLIGESVPNPAMNTSEHLLEEQKDLVKLIANAQLNHTAKGEVPST